MKQQFREQKLKERSYLSLSKYHNLNELFNKNLNKFILDNFKLFKNKLIGYYKPTKKEPDIQFKVDGFKKNQYGKIINQKYDIIFIPCVSFNKNKYRIGYGKGYFDKYLQDKKNIITIGCCFEFLESEFENETHDIKLDYVITENKILN